MLEVLVPGNALSISGWGYCCSFLLNFTNVQQASSWVIDEGSETEEQSGSLGPPRAQTDILFHSPHFKGTQWSQLLKPDC